MPEHAQLIEYLDQRAGENLRVVADYDGDDLHVHYVRDDIPEAEIEARSEVIHERAVTIAQYDAEVAEHVGERYATVTLHRKALFITIPTGTSTGVIISLEPEAGRQLVEFVNACIEYVTGSVPDALE